MFLETGPVHTLPAPPTQLLPFSGDQLKRERLEREEERKREEERGRENEGGREGGRERKRGSIALLNSDHLYESTVSKDVYEEVTNHWYSPTNPTVSSNTAATEHDFKCRLYIYIYIYKASGQNFPSPPATYEICAAGPCGKCSASVK